MRARCAATRSSTTAPPAGAGSSGSLLESRPAPTGQTPASSSRAYRPETRVSFMKRSIAGAAMLKITSSRGRRTLLPIGPPALRSSLAFWLRSCGVAECVGDAVEQRWSEFLHLWRDLGREETLFPPDLAADSGERVGEGWALLAIPSSRRDRQTLLDAPGG